MTGLDITCPRCGFRIVGADPMTRTLPDCRDPLCALDRVGGRPVGPAREDVPLPPSSPGKRGESTRGG